MTITFSTWPILDISPGEVQIFFSRNPIHPDASGHWCSL